MTIDDRLNVVLFVSGVLLFTVSFWTGDSNSRTNLTTEKAMEMQQARRDYHRLSHEYAEQVAEKKSAQNDTTKQEPSDNELLKAEAKFNQLQEEIDAMRNNPPWLSGLLRYGGLTLVLAAGTMAWLRRSPDSQAGSESRIA